ncbi:MAG: hypothetical protein Kow0069_03520 [Promethearchaeota archaeon]
MVYGVRTARGYYTTQYVEGAIHSVEYYEKMTSRLDCAELFGVELFRAVCSAIPPERLFVVPGIYNGLLDSAWQVLGMFHFSRCLVRQRSFLRRVVRERGKYYRAVISRFLDEFEVEAFFLGDDLAYNGRPFVSPAAFREIFLPEYEAIGRLVHRRGAKLVFHSDGNVLPLLDDLLKFADAIHPWQRSAGIDLAEVKRLHGDRVVVMGNVPVDLHVRGPPRRVRDYVEWLMGEVAPGGGYFFSSGNSIVPEVPWKNYVTMLAAFRRLRDYPK